jgi:hypothetical protein
MLSFDKPRGSISLSHRKHRASLSVLSPKQTAESGVSDKSSRLRRFVQSSM